MAKITIRRTSGGGMLGLPIQIDGKKIGRLRPKKEISHEVDAGPHEVVVKRVPAKVTAELELSEDEVVRLVCSEDSGFGSTGKPSVEKTGRALFTAEGGLKLELDESPPD